MRAEVLGTVSLGVVLAVAACSQGGSANSSKSGTEPLSLIFPTKNEPNATQRQSNVAFVNAREVVITAGKPESNALARLSAPTLAGATSKPEGIARTLTAGLLEIDRGWATEHLEQTNDGIEQSWRFESKPETANVRIRIPVANVNLIGSTASGLVFQSSTDRYFTYSNATWVDARGERSMVPARFVSGAVELDVPEAVIQRSTYPAILDPVIGVETTLKPEKLVNAEGIQGDTGHIAVGKSTRLMAWNDSREFYTFAVYFTLFDESSSGIGYDQAVGRKLGYASLTGVDISPAVAYANGMYLVAWASYHTISWARVDESGTILDTTPRTLVVDSGDFTSASAASNGSDFMITWVDRASGNGDVRALRVGNGGVALDSQPIAVVSDSYAQAAPSIRASADGYWIVFQDKTSGDNDVRLVRVSSTGTVIDAPPVSLVQTYADQSHPDIAFDGSGLSGLLVWDDSATLAVHGASISASSGGTVTVGTPARISIGSGERSPRAVFNGSNFQVAWISSQNGSPAPQVALVDSAPARANGVAVGVGPSNFVDLAVRGSQVEAFWDSTNDQTRSADVFHQIGTTTNSWLGSAYLVSRAATTQLVPRIANNASRFMVAWENPRIGGKGIQVARVNPLGEFEDPTPIEVSNTAQDVKLAGIYSNGTNFLVVWQQYEYDAMAQRMLWRTVGRQVSDAGVPAVTIETFRNATYSLEGVDAWVNYGVSPAAYMVTFIDGDVIYTAQINSAGVRGKSEFVSESDTIVDALELRATAAYVYYLSTDGYLHRVTHKMGGMGGTSENFVTLPGSKSNFDVTSTDVLAIYNSSAGTVSIATSAWSRTLSTGLTADANPQITAINGGYFVAWNEGNGIVGVRVTTDGQVMDAHPATISQEAGTELLGDLFDDFLNRCIMVYSRPLWVPGVGAWRAATRLIDFRYNTGKPNGQGCSSGFDCASGYCADGVCCNTGCGYSIVDCQACSVAAGAAVDGMCSTLAAGSVCRASTGVCDLAETCNGSSTACPTDAFSSATTACGNSPTGPCDKADHCAGISGACVAEGMQPSGTICRESRGVCDKADVCNGTSAECTEQLYGVDHVCRQAADACDAVEYCDGQSDVCGQDALKVEGTECRKSAGTCDVAESCDGVSKTCPSNGFMAANTVCREASTQCDVAETCTGVSATCPADTGAAACGGATGTGGTSSQGVSGGSDAGGMTVSLDPSTGGTSAVAPAGGTSSTPVAANESDSGSGCGCRAPHRMPREFALLSSLVVCLSYLRRRKQHARGVVGSATSASVAAGHE